MKKLLVSLLLVSFPITVFADYVNSPEGLNVRKSATVESESFALLRFGDEVDVIKSGIGKDKNWARILLDSEEYGFVCTDYLQKTNPFDEMTLLGEWRITAYAWTGNPCANGNYPETGYTVACTSLSLGTEIYIEGVGFRTVEDRGPNWLGSDWCDLYLGNALDCIQWGNQYRNVWLVGGE